MAWAVPAWKSHPVAIDCESTHYFQQNIEVSVTGLNSDVDFDLGDLAPGTFFTSANADGTHGAKATALMAHLTALVSLGITQCVRVYSESLDCSYVRSVGAPAALDQYQIVNFTNHIPTFLFLTGGAPTTFRISLCVNLLSTVNPIAPVKYGTI